MKLKIQGIVILVLLSFSAYAQKVKYLDYDGEKTSKRRAAYKVTSIDEDENHKKQTSIYTFNNRVAYEGIYLKESDDIIDGYYKAYYHNGQLYISSEYINGKKVGVETEYNKDGKLRRELTYNKKGIGEEFVYYKSGAIKKKNLYKNENLEGLCQTFFESGALESETVYESNKIQGEAKTYFETGNLECVYLYLDDEKHGDFKEYYKTGELESSGNMVSGKEQGDFYSFYKSGVKRRYENYIDGEADKKRGKCFTTDGSETKYFPRSIYPLVNKEEIQQGLIKCIIKQFKYPTTAEEMGFQDKIYVSFVFTKEGGIDDVKIENRGPYFEILGQEALRLVNLIREEKITNGFFEGKPVDISYMIPIRFKIK